MVWGNGPPGESRLLPKLPDETHIHALPEVHEQGFHLESGEGPSVLSTSQVFTSDHLGASCSGQSGQLPIMPVFADDRGDHHEGTSSSVLSPPDVAQRPTIDAQVRKTCPIELERHARLLQITSHGYAMADDEIMFQLQHIAACQSDANPRQFIVLPPLHLIQWLHGDDAALHDWISRNRHWLGVEDHHVFTVLLHEQHWIPIWLAPGHGGMMAHTLADFAADEGAVDQILFHLVHKCGSAILAIHRVPHGLPIQRLCGVMSICFLAHVILRTRLPTDIEALYARFWSIQYARP